MNRRTRGKQSPARTWIAPPEHDDDKVRAATGKGWNEWCDLIDTWPGHTEGHGVIVSHLQDVHGVDSWWSQAVTVGYERITGIRLRYQQPDGTFTASTSRTAPVHAGWLRQRLLDQGWRDEQFAGHESELRSRPTAKAVRVAIGPGVAQFTMEPQPGDKVKVTITHERLPSPAAVEEWKRYWKEWLAAIDDRGR